jgi:hypothetical protein
MKSNFWIGATALGALALQACSTASTETSSPSVGEHQESVITVRGTNTEGVQAAPIAIGSVEVTVDGRSVLVMAEPSVVDLADEQGRVAARFSVPAGAEQVVVRISLDDFGGYEKANGEAGVLDARGTNLTFEIPAHELAENGRAEIAFDLAKSLVSVASGMRLIPQLTVTY